MLLLLLPMKSLIIYIQFCDSIQQNKDVAPEICEQLHLARSRHYLALVGAVS